MNTREMLAHEWQRVLAAGRLNIEYDPNRCVGTWQCYEVCPVGCWTPDLANRVAVYDPEGCVACGACVLQCPEGAIKLK